MKLLDRNLSWLIDLMLVRIFGLVKTEKADVIAVFVVNQVRDLPLELLHL